MPDPVLVAIAAALAGKGASHLYDLVKRKFSREPAATEALEAAREKQPGSAEIDTLAATLAKAEAADPAFSAQLHTAWEQHQQTIAVQQTGRVINQNLGTAQQVVQLGEVHGNVNLGGPQA